MASPRSNKSSRPRSSSQSSSSSEEPDPLTPIIARLKELARGAKASRVPYHEDASEHYTIFRRAVSNVLSTDLALFTFAQIVDGLPIADVAWDRRVPGIHGDDHPIEEHPVLCPGVEERTREIRQQLDLSVLEFAPSLLKAYQKATSGSQAFAVWLIELVAVSVHQLAALLFQLDASMHKGGPLDVERITQHVDPPLAPGLAVFPARPTLFSHHGYLHDDIYPDGVADVVGYWAEDRILGGVAVFDRPAEQRTPQQPPNAYFHACRDNVTFRYFQLRDDQQQALVNFFLAEDCRSAPCPLPVLGDAKNRVRVDPQEAILRRHIYRDVWDRKPPTAEAVKVQQGRPMDEVDYPEQRELLDAVNEALGVPPPPRPSDMQENDGDQARA